MSDEIKKIHFVGVGGTGVGTLAVALSKSGYGVSGSDGALYEPMKSVLASAKVKLFEGYDSATLKKIQPDLVVIGNVIRRDNPEASAWIRSGCHFISFPEAVRRFLIGNRKSIVCAGTHGKTTTTSWISFLFKELDQNPNFLIGGVPVDLSSGAERNGGAVFVGEGDEYDSAFFDKGPKFLHYHPWAVVLSNIEFDHADIYKDLAHIQRSFEKLIGLIPVGGICIARYEDETVQKVIPQCAATVETFGTSAKATWCIESIRHSEAGVEFDISHQQKSGRKHLGTFSTPLFGEHNVLNLVSGIAVASYFGHSIERIRCIVPKFNGCRRRQQILMQTPVVLIDDFAHHPTEVNATLSAVRKRYPSRKLWAFFEPRSATARRGTHQDLYPKAFDPADIVLLSEPYKKEEGGFSSTALAKELRNLGKEAESFDSVEQMVKFYNQAQGSQDLLVVMSNGEFGKIQEKLKALFL